uniref:Uncharacterized protein n=1 Tax=Timema tahoe TaxID=61484 RepID=A0A7R9ITH5_9NEOP|nr:unnamed protein product [Timema tahoe]
MEMAKAVSFGIDSNFLVAILVCVAILLILLLAVVVHRRKTDDMFKDTDDIRENIINYEDEGGGEGDMTGYDLNVLRLMYDQDGLPIVDKPPLKESYHTRSVKEIPFLRDRDSRPFDAASHEAFVKTCERLQENIEEPTSDHDLVEKMRGFLLEGT